MPKLENKNVELLASLARTASTSKEFQNINALGGHIVIDVTNVVSTGSITVKIQGKDAVSGKFYDILSSASIATTGTTVLKVYPGLGVTANVSANDILPVDLKLVVTAGDSNAVTYSVAINLM